LRQSKSLKEQVQKEEKELMRSAFKKLSNDMEKNCNYSEKR